MLEGQWAGSDAGRPLSPRGMRQAALLGRMLKGEDIRELRCSPYARCIETAMQIGLEIGVNPVVDERLHIAREFHARPTAVNAVWVAHSNNIPEAVVALGVACHACAVASVWRLEFDNAGKLVSAGYLDTPKDRRWSSSQVQSPGASPS
jgi:phosphohistidine phosphatase SixA